MSMPPNVTVEVSKAERDAIAQVVRKADAHGLNNYERDLLKQLLARIDRLAGGGLPPIISSTPPTGGGEPQQS